MAYMPVGKIRMASWDETGTKKNPGALPPFVKPKPPKTPKKPKPDAKAAIIRVLRTPSL